MVMRTYGLSGSGIDVDQLVKDMMKARRASYDKLWQKKTQLEYKKADYYTMYTSLKDFRDTTAFNYKLQSTLLPKKISSSAEDKVTATANADAANISHTMTVNQLAEGAKMMSAGSISLSTNKDSLISQFNLDPTTYNSSFKIVLENGSVRKEISVDPTKSIYEFVKSINDNSDLGIKANYDATLDRFFLSTTGTGSSVGIKLSSTTDPNGIDFINKSLKLADVTTITDAGLSSNIGTKDENLSLSTLFGLDSNTEFKLKLTSGSTTIDVTVKASESLRTLISNINATNIAVANYDSGTGSFTLQAKSGETLSVAGSDQAAIDFLKDKLNLGITQSLPDAISGQDAQFTLDGVNLTQSTNNFTISGVTYNLKATTGGTPVNIAVSPDNDKSIEVVNNFIKSYNEILDKINGELNEEKYSDYLPLTDDQKKEMKEFEITEWDKRAKSGMLRRDSILQDIVFKLRSDVSTPIEGLTGKYNSLSAIGVTTGDYSEGGKLHLDETKLKAALEADPDILDKIFNSDGTTHDQKGVAERIYDTLKDSLDKLETVAGLSSTISGDTQSTLAKLIMSYNKDLDRMNDRLKDIEDRYYKQFDAMEAALNRLNQQNGWLLAQFSGQ